MPDENEIRKHLASRTAVLLGAFGLLASLAMISRLAWSDWRARAEVDERFHANAGVSGAMVAVPPAYSVPGFLLDETEVTVVAYRACVDGGACTAPSTGGLCNWGETGRDDHPVNCVDWFQAKAFCAWAGKRLPRQREWELGGCGIGEGHYPWGREAPEAQDCFARGEVVERRSSPTVVASPARGTCPARDHAKSPRGFFGMGGNVAEWTATELHERDAVGSRRPIHMGASWATPLRATNYRKPPFDCEVQEQHAASYRSSLLGFRCARDAPR